MAGHLSPRERREQLKRTVRDQACLRTLRRYLDEEYMNDEGVGVIDVCLYEGLELYDPLSCGRQRELNPEIPPGLEEITMKAMASRIDQRYVNAGAMLRVLEGGEGYA